MGQDDSDVDPEVIDVDDDDSDVELRYVLRAAVGTGTRVRG